MHTQTEKLEGTLTMTATKVTVSWKGSRQMQFK